MLDKTGGGGMDDPAVADLRSKKLPYHGKSRNDPGGARLNAPDGAGVHHLGTQTGAVQQKHAPHLLQGFIRKPTGRAERQIAALGVPADIIPTILLNDPLCVFLGQLLCFGDSEADHKVFLPSGNGAVRAPEGQEGKVLAMKGNRCKLQRRLRTAQINIVAQPQLTEAARRRGSLQDRAKAPISPHQHGAHVAVFQQLQTVLQENRLFSVLKQRRKLVVGQ